jgi:hypothetical protein
MGKEEDKEKDGEGPKGKKDPMTETVTAGNPSLGKEDKTHSREEYLFESASVQKVNQKGH